MEARRRGVCPYKRRSDTAGGVDTRKECLTVVKIHKLAHVLDDLSVYDLRGGVHLDRVVSMGLARHFFDSPVL